MKKEPLRQNSFNLLRLIFATFVIIQHVFILTGVENRYVFSKNGNIAIGTIGIWGFFAISGFLLTRSISTQKIKLFLLRRVYRVYPALWVCLFITSFTFALAFEKNLAVSAKNSLQYTILNSTSYVFQKIPTNLETKQLIGGSLNGSLWSLFPEIFTYLIFAIFWAIFKKYEKQKYFAIYIVLLILSIIIWINRDANFTLQKNFVYQLLPLFLAFGTGVVMQLKFMSKGKSFPRIGFSICILFVVTLKFELLRPIGVILFSILVIILGQRFTKGPIAKLGSKNDISFGLYLYHWPVLQALMFSSDYFNQLPILIKILVLWIITWVFAWTSWSLVEKKMIRLSRLLN
jgi:peptidoglycan/LPS O-acetylase OafA/YrhL